MMPATANRAATGRSQPAKIITTHLLFCYISLGYCKENNPNGKIIKKIDKIAFTHRTLNASDSNVKRLVRKWITYQEWIDRRPHRV